MIVFRNLGKALRQLREERGQSQKQAAEATGVTPPMLSAYENDRTNPELETLDKILHGLGASLRDLERALQRAEEPAEPTELPGEPGMLRAEAAAMLDELASRPGLLSAPLPPEMEEGYAEIARGLLRISRFVFESVSEGYQTSANPTPPGE